MRRRLPFFFLLFLLPLLSLTINMAYVGFFRNSIVRHHEVTNIEQQIHNLQGMSAWLQTNFKKLDADGDGTITRPELERCVGDPQFHGNEAVSLDTLLDEFQVWTNAYEINQTSNSGLTISGINRLNKFLKDPYSDNYPKQWAPAARKLAERMIDITNRLHQVNSLPDNVICQGYAGTCPALSALISVSEYDSGIMDRIISANKDKSGKIVSYTVSFPGIGTLKQYLPDLTESSVTVSPPTDAEMANYAQGLKTNIIEKAMAILVCKVFAKSTKSETDFYLPVAQIRENHYHIHPGVALALLVDDHRHLYEINHTAISDHDLLAVLMQAQTESEPVTCSTSRDKSGVDEKSGLIYKHTYSVHYDVASGMLIITNPFPPKDHWSEPRDATGHAKDGKQDSKFKLSIAEYRRLFERTDLIKK